MFPSSNFQSLAEVAQTWNSKGDFSFINSFIPQEQPLQKLRSSIDLSSVIIDAMGRRLIGYGGLTL